MFALLTFLLETKLSLISPKNAPLISYCVFLQMIILLSDHRLHGVVTCLALPLHSKYNVIDESV